MKFNELVELLTERPGHRYPTAPLHSEGVPIMGYERPQIYVGWRISDCAEMEEEWDKFIKSTQSELPQMVKNLPDFLETMRMYMEEFAVNEDEHETDQKIVGYGVLGTHTKIMQDIEEYHKSHPLDPTLDSTYEKARNAIITKLIHLIGMKDYDTGQMKMTYTHITFGKALESVQFGFNGLHAKLEEAKADLLMKVNENPELIEICKTYGFTPENIGAYVDGNQEGGLVFEG